MNNSAPRERFSAWITSLSVTKKVMLAAVLVFAVWFLTHPAQIIADFMEGLRSVTSNAR